jgi:heterodisulfide reductase subunit A2
MKPYHAIIVGGGITGLESAISLANLGHRVLVVERQASIGGNMIALSKVFPTLDCASCITTPKMSEASHHDNIDILTYTEVLHIRKAGEDFQVTVLRKPRYVDAHRCIGCGLCEQACPVYVKHEFERNLGARKAICIPFTTAIPQTAILNPQDCIQCGRCYDACPTEPKAIDYDQPPLKETYTCRSVIIATGFDVTPADLKKEYQDGTLNNVVTSFQLERILSPSGPYGAVLRPGDGKVPDNVTFVLCAGSRDRSIGVPYCSRVCCMYSIKQAMLLSGALPLADLTLYYIDIRAFGKNYEQFYRNAEAMGIRFVKAKVARIREKDNGDLLVRIENQEETGAVQEVTHDLVVLASGIVRIVKEKKIGAACVGVAVREAWKVGFGEMLAFRRYRQCDSETQEKQNVPFLLKPWFLHACVAWGFLGLFAATLWDYVHKDPSSFVSLIYPPRLLGTVSGIFLMYGTSVILFKRAKGKEKTYANSVFSDWWFLVMLWFVGGTGLLLEILVYFPPASQTLRDVLFVVHVAPAIELVALAAFSKLAHVIYRPAALFTYHLRNSLLRMDAPAKPPHE